MKVRINTNISAMNAHRLYSSGNRAVQKDLQKLSSGLRINSASDDAAGLAISEKMRGQIRGLNQASRNIQDGISLLQVADGGLNEIHSLLQRGRELCVQAANGTQTVSDRQSLQIEAEQILREIDRIAQNTEFNTIKVLNVTKGSSSDMVQIVNGLKSAWLQQSEARILAQYGIQGDGASLKIVLDQSPMPYLAAVSYMIDGSGKAVNQELHIDVSDFTPATLPNGGTAPLYDDRIIAHEMVHAIMGRTMNFASLPNWFKEGTAEFIHGADERLWADSAGGTNFAGVVAEIGSWEGTSIDYSTAYGAVKYLHQQVVGGIQAVMNHLSTNQADTLDDALAAVSPYASTADFLADYAANGVAFLGTLNLTDADTGAIGGGDAEGVIPDGINYTDDPLTGFVEEWPATDSPSEPMKIQLGANSGQGLDLELVKADSASIGLSNVDLVNNADSSISWFDAAISAVSSERSRIGAYQNRLEHAMAVTEINSENTTSSESRIRDVDMAKDMMNYTKNNILLQAASAMLAQANQQPQQVLNLLKTA